MISEIVRQISIWALPILAAIILHEVAHGWVAYRLGDTTAARMGRLTLNPVSHVDLFGTIILPLFLILARAPFLFGYAKPVPVSFNKLRRPKSDMVWVALAGPLTNLVLALGSALLLKFLLSVELPADRASTPYLLAVLTPLALMAKNSVVINVVLAVFNAFPIPPLDGGRVLVGLLPEPQSSTLARVEPYGFLVILVLLMSHAMDAFMNPAVRLLLRLFDGIL